MVVLLPNQTTMIGWLEVQHQVFYIIEVGDLNSHPNLKNPPWTHKKVCYVCYLG